MYERDRHMDRQIRHRMTATVGRARIALRSKNSNKTAKINVKNFHGSLTTVVRAQNDTPKGETSQVLQVFLMTRVTVTEVARTRGQLTPDKMRCCRRGRTMLRVCQ